MIKPAIPENENERLNALKEYSILDTIPEKEYDEITELASFICQTPISLISLIDDKRQWFKSHYGTNTEFTPREVAFCAHAINDQNNMLIVPDSRKDKRFHDNPIVTDDPHVIFYAGIPLVNPEGYPLGTLCVIDNKPNTLSEDQVGALRALSNQLMKLFELRKTSENLRIYNKELENKNCGLENFARIAAHDIKSPLNNIIMTAELFKNNYSDNVDKEGIEFLSLISSSSIKLSELIDGILQYSHDSTVLSNCKETIDVNETVKEITRLLDAEGQVQFEIEIRNSPILFINKTAFEQILMNLISNCIKYNDKEQTKISIKIFEAGDLVKATIADNGPGIKARDRERIFEIFQTTSNMDKNGSNGTGIGLATVKSLVEGLGGEIKVFSEYGYGSTFEFTIKKN